MYQVTLFNGAGRRTTTDLHDLYLADGTKAFTYLHDAATLYRRLKAEKVPQIEVTMGSIDLMLALARHRVATKVDQVTGRVPEGDTAA